MSQILLTKPAVDKILEHPETQKWMEGQSNKVPVLSYYQRSYSTLRDGTVIEHGDGFMLAFVAPVELTQTKNAAFVAVPFAGGRDIYVAADSAMLSQDFTITYADRKFTLLIHGAGAAKLTEEDVDFE